MHRKLDRIEVQESKCHSFPPDTGDSSGTKDSTFSRINAKGLYNQLRICGGKKEKFIAPGYFESRI